ncbi:MAG: hypothetical protein KAJ42_02500 [Gemmatimonadetes bacterium]|nr:hypothetical protein [Gemmatimonadota bacterium]
MKKYSGLTATLASVGAAGVPSAVNITGDLTASAVVAKSEGEELIPRVVDYPIGIGKP